MSIDLPDTPFVEVEFGDYRLGSSPPKQKIQSFIYTRNKSDKGNFLELEVFDDKVIEIEEKIIENRENVLFRYGWNVQNVSDVLEGMVVNYSSTLFSESRTASLTIEIMSMAVKSFTKDRRKTYKNEDGEPMKIHEIVEDIAEYEEWEIGKIVKTEKVIDFEQARSVEEEEYGVDVTSHAQEPSEGHVYSKGEKVFSQDGISSIKFIKDELIPNAVSVDGRGGYDLWFEDKKNTPIINFAPISYNESAKEEYIYKLGGRNSRVISFTHQNEGRVQLVGGDANLKGEFTDSVTNDLVKREVSLEDLERDFAEKRRVDSDSKAIRYMGDSSANSYEAFNRYKSYREKAQSYAYQATLEVRGNPSLFPGDKIDVFIFTDNGEYHHSSGRYEVYQIVDEIAEGSYVSSLALRRDTTNIEEVLAEGDR